MLGVEDPSILIEFEEAEKSNPSPRKIMEDRVIYSSRQSQLCKSPWPSYTIRLWGGSLQLKFLYRDPEVVLRMPWDHKIDIWILGVFAWGLFEQSRLFYTRDSGKNRSDSHHLAGIIAILGPPPKDTVQNSEYGRQFFDREGKGPMMTPRLVCDLLTRKWLMSET
ncbi:hypothetical protein NUU61_008960 [Penicillium alfredii]|uniref:Protein kinase domain-containing protein n=1 Tax=Penicillium alfredii TaxID=1506179 RepID=A0A9W9EM91_9EURO|nr:uncharacterized protein NUU61_008960 [Penicillium alfredii]KAJ5084381.1 hypothetical protein NUU61_008960 [Penicillium alfredii]